MILFASSHGQTVHCFEVSEIMTHPVSFLGNKLFFSVKLETCGWSFSKLPNLSGHVSWRHRLLWGRCSLPWSHPQTSKLWSLSIATGLGSRQNELKRWRILRQAKVLNLILQRLRGRSWERWRRTPKKAPMQAMNSNLLISHIKSITSMSMRPTTADIWWWGWESHAGCTWITRQSVRVLARRTGHHDVGHHCLAPGHEIDCRSREWSYRKGIEKLITSTAQEPAQVDPF